MYPENLASDSKWMLGKNNIVGWSEGEQKHRDLSQTPHWRPSPQDRAPLRILPGCRRARHLTPCLENFHGLRSLVGYSPWHRKESDTTAWLHSSLKTPKVQFPLYVLPHHITASLVTQWQRIRLPVQETRVQSLAGEDPLEEEETITRSSIPAWEIPWTERSLVGYSPWSHRESGWTEHITSFKQELTHCSYTDTGRLMTALRGPPANFPSLPRQPLLPPPY